MPLAMPEHPPPPLAPDIGAEPAKRSTAPAQPGRRGTRFAAKALAEAEVCRKQIAMLRRHLCDLRRGTAEPGPCSGTSSELDSALEEIDIKLEACERSLATILLQMGTPPVRTELSPSATSRACR